MTNMWMVRCGPNSIFFDDFIKENIVAIGWVLGDLSNVNKEEIPLLVKKAYPKSSNRNINQATGIIWNFVHNFQIGDYVVTYNPSERGYIVGKIVSDYKYISDIDNTELINQRDVEWFNGMVPRDELSIKSRKALNNIITVFCLNEVKENILKVLDKHTDNHYELIVNKIRKFLNDNNLGNFEQEVAVE